MTIQDALTCLAEAPFNGLALITGLDRSRDTGEVKAGKSGDWAYRTVTGGFRYESVYTWGGWYSPPTGFMTWDKIDKALAGDERITAARAWAETAIAAQTGGWREVIRPYRFTPHPTTWHPRYLASDTERDGWEDRLHHWEQAITACHDAAAAQPIEAEQLDMLALLEEMTQ